MGKINCNLVADLMPSFIEGLTSEETSNEIKEHLIECDECRCIFEATSHELVEKQNSNFDVDKKIVRKIRNFGFAFILKFSLFTLMSFFAILCFYLFSQNNIYFKYPLILLSGILGYFLFKKWIIFISSFALMLAVSIIFSVITLVPLAITMLIVSPLIILVYSLSYFLTYGIVNLLSKQNIKNYAITSLLLISLIAVIFIGALDYAANATIANIFMQTRYANLKANFESISFSPGEQVAGCLPGNTYNTKFKDKNGKEYMLYVANYNVCLTDDMYDWKQIK
jgi:hypothetical protein